MDSSLAYQGGGRDLGVQPVRAINEFATGGLSPDLTLLLRISPEVGRQRAGQRGEALDRLEQEPDAFFARIADTYDALAAASPDRIRVIDGARPPAAVLADAVVALAQPALERRAGSPAYLQSPPVTEGWKSIELDVFEHVVTGPSQSLLRVSGKAAPGSEAAPKPTLVVGAAPAQQRFAPLRAPQDRGGVLRAAYAVPTALVQSGAPCWLEFDDGEQTELPVPAEGTARMRDEGGDAGGASAALPEPAPQRPLRARR